MRSSLVELRNASKAQNIFKPILLNRTSELVLGLLERLGFIRSFIRLSTPNNRLSQALISFNGGVGNGSFSSILLFSGRNRHHRFVSYEKLLKITKHTPGVFICSCIDLGMTTHDRLLKLRKGGVLIAYLH